MDSVAPALHRAIFCLDIEEFGSQCRADPDRVAVRAKLYRALRIAFAQSVVSWDGCYHEDRGDGALVLVPPDVPKDLLVGPVLDDFVAAVGLHNEEAAAARKMRLRLAVHAGEIRWDAHGVVGTALNHAFRLLEAGEAKVALRGSSASIALITSDWFFDEVIRHSPRVRAGDFRRIQVAVKETQAHAWLRLLEGPRRSGGGRAVAGAPTTVLPIMEVPRQLPAAVRNFVGRAEELAALTRFMEESDRHGGQAMTVAITGTAGVGKTALAVHWAHRVRERFPDGDLYVDLHGYGPGVPVTAEQALDVMLRSLGLLAETIPVGVEARATAYRSHLTRRQVLVVLDNAADAEQVRPLLPGSAGCVTVVTSRSRLTGLVAGDGAHPVSMNHLTEAEAVGLLRHIIGDSRVDNEPAAALDIARHCALLPLALRIAAEQTAARVQVALAEVAGDLADEQQRLNRLDTDDPSTAVRVVFSSSYRALPADPARVFRLLGLHPGPDISIEAAATLIDSTPAEARRVLDRLTGLHLLEETTHGRYHFHDLLRLYAGEAAHDEETNHDLRAAERRILGWYLHAFHDAGMILYPGSPNLLKPIAGLTYWPPSFSTADQAIEWSERDLVNSLAATRRAAESGHHDLAWRIPVMSYCIFYMRKYWDDGIIALKVGLSSARSIQDHNGEAYILVCLGSTHHDLRQFDDALDCFHHALRLFRDTGDRWGEGIALFGLGGTYRGLREFENATDCCRQCLSIFRETGDPLAESLVLIQLGYATGGLCQFNEAIEYFQAAVTISEAPSKRIHGWTQHGLSYAHRGLGQYLKAIEHSEQALVLFEETHDPWGQGETLYGLGRAQHNSGQHDAAHHSLTRALAIFEDLSTQRAELVRAYLQAFAEKLSP
jgi:tetratricopeptide (TPR) repeat protein